MGEVTRALLMRMCAEAAVEAVDSLLSTSQLLGGLAKAVIEEDVPELCNPHQLIEASARCIDTIELIVEACRPPEHELEEWEQTDLYQNLVQVRRQLDKMRKTIIDLDIPENNPKETDGHRPV